MQMQDDDVSERPYIHGQIMTYVTYSMAEFLKASSTDGSWRPTCTRIMQQKQTNEQ